MRNARRSRPLPTFRAMTAMKRQRISAIDNAWLRMDRPSNLMMICGVLIFREKIELARLRKVIAERFMVFKRFRQRPVETPAMSFWEADAHFDIDHHVAHTALPGRAGKAELQAFASRLMSTPLDPSRPRWQFHLVDNYDGGSALVARIHHCYADGIALVRVMLSMTDATRGRSAGDAVRAARAQAVPMPTTCWRS